jgi:hypothetical protein
VWGGMGGGEGDIGSGMKEWDGAIQSGIDIDTRHVARKGYQESILLQGRHAHDRI